MSTFSPGWYPDPYDPQQQRYWDGANWTEHTYPGAAVVQTGEPAIQPAAQFAPHGGGSAEAAQRRSRPWLWWVVGSAAALLIAGAAVGVWWATSAGSENSADASACDSSQQQCESLFVRTPTPAPSVERPSTAPRPTAPSTTTPRTTQPQGSDELQRFCEVGAVEAYLDFQTAVISVFGGHGTVAAANAQLDAFEQELALMPAEVAASDGYRAAEAEIRDFIADSRAALSAGEHTALADLILEGPDVVAAFSGSCAGHGYIGW